MPLKKYDITYSLEIPANHPTLAKPYVHGAIKAFFVPSVRYGREIVELAQRMDLDFSTVTIDKAWDLNKWGIGDYYDLRASVWDFELLYQNLENILTSDEHFDVLILPGLNGWGNFSDKTIEAIHMRVQLGAGLVLIKPFYGEGLAQVERLHQLSAMHNLFEEGLGSDKLAGEGFPILATDKLHYERWQANTHYITHGIPFELFPYDEMAFYPYQASGEVILQAESGMPIAAVKEYGKGRVVTFGYFPRDILPQHRKFTGKENTFDPMVELWSGARSQHSFAYLEYFYSLIYRSILWTARKEPESSLSGMTLTEDNAIIHAINLPEQGYEYHYRIKNNFDHIIHESQSQSNYLVFPAVLKIGGQFRLEVRLMIGGKVSDWMAKALFYEKKLYIDSLNADCRELQTGQTLTVDLKVKADLGHVVFKVIDDYERILHCTQHAVSASPLYNFSYKAESTHSLYIRVIAELQINGICIDRKETARIVITPEKRSIDDFEVFMTPQNRGQGDFLSIIGERFREMGVTGIFPGSPKTLAMSGAEGMGIYWYKRAPYVQKKESYLRTKNKSFLIRTPCLNDPEFWLEMQHKIRAAVRKNKKFGVISYFANDEGSITCYEDEFDFCFCAHCMTLMQSWLRDQYNNSLEELTQAWGKHITGWNEAIPYTTEEARKTGQYASWSDHRSFMELTFSNAYKKITDTIRLEDPQGITRMSGCQASTAYSGYDYYQLYQHVGYFEAYSVGNQYEFHRSFANPSSVIGGWFGYGAKGISVKNKIWNALYHNLTLISIFWEYACINPDFTFSQSAVDMSEAFKEIKQEGIGKLLLYNAKRDHLGIAIHYSMPSVHGTTILGRHQQFKKNRQGWVSALEDLGYQYNFVATQQIEAGHLLKEDYKLLILPYSIAITGAEAAAIAQFVNAGGTVIGDFQTGLMNGHCQLLEQGILDGLFGIERLSLASEAFFTNDSFTMNKGFAYFQLAVAEGLVLAEPGIRITTGSMAFVDEFMGSIAAGVVNVCGAGKAIYMNMALDAYTDWKPTDSAAIMLRELLKQFLALAAVSKPVDLKTPDDMPLEQGYESFYYQNEGLHYVGILKGLDTGVLLGHDGLEVHSDKASLVKAAPFKMDFAQKSHVYDIRKKQYLGYRASLEVILSTGDTLLLACMPYRLNSISLEIPEQCVGGEKLTLYAALEAELDDHTLLGSHVLSIQFYNPAGKSAWTYHSNEVTVSSISKSYQLPFNEVKGTWHILVKDAATGVSVKKQFELI